ncbi:LysR family transcriptional regulator [Roseovarius pelagicus]|uniref:LysR family transcriptional regulator n=1 Tax=Roseovarius pelagicus TaxID=2980108 RepID=A0ABY6DAJ3_9RHOB|nr:LysR family transcriptional regulator [Roseovarius pelagicus]UXX82063.1 LysR family transcriptional regulator [Roseovarius pelagicus]
MNNDPFPDLPPLALKHLHSFVVVAQFGSFSQAAAAMSRTPSAISMQIKSLESVLGFSLFERSTRHVRLTEDGRKLADATRLALIGVETTLRNVRRERGLSDNRISIGFLPSLAAMYVPNLLTDLAARLPDLSVDIYEASSEKLLEMISSNQIALAVGQTMDHVDHLQFDPLKDEPLFALLRKDLIPAQGAETHLTLTELCDVPLLLFDRSTGMGQLVLKDIAAAGLSYTTKYQCVNAHTLVAMAEVGLGAAILPLSVISAIPSEGTIALPIEQPSLKRTIALIRRKDGHFSRPGQAVAKRIRRLMSMNNNHDSRP